MRSGGRLGFFWLFRNDLGGLSFLEDVETLHELFGVDLTVSVGINLPDYLHHFLGEVSVHSTLENHR